MKKQRILGVTIITAVGLAACGQTNTDHKNMNLKKRNRAKGNENESGSNCAERNEQRGIE